MALLKGQIKISKKKTITARSFKLGQLIEINEYNHVDYNVEIKKKIFYYFQVIALCKFGH